MSKLQIVQRFAKEIANKDSVITQVNDKFYFDGLVANEEMQAFYNQLTDAKIDEAIKVFNSLY